MKKKEKKKDKRRYTVSIYVILNLNQIMEKSREDETRIVMKRMK